jgi:hypothetical protein
MSYETRMREHEQAANAHRASKADELIALAVEYYNAQTVATATGEPSDRNRVHRAHDTSKYPRRAKPLSGDWNDIATGASRVDHVKVIRADSAHHLPMTAYRKARKARATSDPNAGAAAAQARADHRAALLASVGNNADVD